LAEFISNVAPTALKKYLMPVLLRTLGIASGFWGWIAWFAVTIVWGKVIKRILSAARKQDQKEIDDENEKTYMADKKAGAPVEKLIEDETDLINGNRRKL
jgi:hypothetical protein